MLLKIFPWPISPERIKKMGKMNRGREEKVPEKGTKSRRVRVPLWPPIYKFSF